MQKIASRNSSTNGTTRLGINKIKMNQFYQKCLTIPLTSLAHHLARQFASKQNRLQKAKQVYLNTLAILAVKDFLEELSYPTDLELGDSWNSAISCFHDTADLFVLNLSKLECRPLVGKQTTISLPREVREERRIGYVFVQFQEQVNEVQLLGFIRALDPISAPEKIALAELEPIDNLIDYLYRLEIATEILQKNRQIAAIVPEKDSTQFLSEIIAQFDRIIRTVEPDKQINKGTEILNLWVSEDYCRSQRELQLNKIARRLRDNLLDIWQIETSPKVPEWSILKWLSDEIDELAKVVGWSIVEFEPSVAGIKAIDSPIMTRSLTRQLEIAGQNYELRIIPQSINSEESTWRFQLRNLAPGGFIPGGFKLKLLTRDGEDFEGNQDLATTATEELYLDITVENGEGLIWVTEPYPQNYRREIFRF